MTRRANLLSHNRRRVAKADPAPARTTVPATTVDTSCSTSEPVEATRHASSSSSGRECRPSDIVVLTRVNTFLAPVQVALHEAGIPVLNREGGSLPRAHRCRRRPVVARAWPRRDRASAGPTSSAAARRPGRSLSPKVIEWMGEQRDVDGLRRLAGRVQEKDAREGRGASPPTSSAIRGPRGVGAPPTAWSRSCATRSGLDRAMQTLDAAHRGRNTAAHSDDLRALIALGALHPDPSRLRARGCATRSTPAATATGVQLSTVHRVKGLEWPHVVVHDASRAASSRTASAPTSRRSGASSTWPSPAARPTVTIVADAGEPVAVPRRAARGGAVLRGLRVRTTKPPVRLRREGRTSVFDSTPKKRAPAEREGFRRGRAEGGVGRVRLQGRQLEPDGVILSPGKARFTVAYGSLVDIGGRPHRLVAGKAKQRSSKKSAAASGVPLDDADAAVLVVS